MMNRTEAAGEAARDTGAAQREAPAACTGVLRTRSAAGYGRREAPA